MHQLLLAPIIAAEIEGDAIQPRGELRLSLEPFEAAVRSQERILHHIACLFFTPERAIGQGVDRPLPAGHQLAECILISGGRARDQFLV